MQMVLFLMESKVTPAQNLIIMHVSINTMMNISFDITLICIVLLCHLEGYWLHSIS